MTLNVYGQCLVRTSRVLRVCFMVQNAPIYVFLTRLLSVVVQSWKNPPPAAKQSQRHTEACEHRGQQYLPHGTGEAYWKKLGSALSTIVFGITVNKRLLPCRRLGLDGCHEGFLVDHEYSVATFQIEMFYRPALYGAQPLTVAGRILSTDRHA